MSPAGGRLALHRSDPLPLWHRTRQWRVHCLMQTTVLNDDDTPFARLPPVADVIHYTQNCTEEEQRYAQKDDKLGPLDRKFTAVRFNSETKHPVLVYPGKVARETAEPPARRRQASRRLAEALMANSGARRHSPLAVRRHGTEGYAIGTYWRSFPSGDADDELTTTRCQLAVLYDVALNAVWAPVKRPFRMSQPAPAHLHRNRNRHAGSWPLLLLRRCLRPANRP